MDEYDLIFNSNSDMLTIYESTMRLMSYLETEMEKLNEEKDLLMARCSVLNYGFDLIKYSVFEDFKMNPDQSCKELIIDKLNQLKKLKLEVEELKRKNQEVSSKQKIENILDKKTIKRIMDEAHRFAIGYHRKLRRKSYNIDKRM